MAEKDPADEVVGERPLRAYDAKRLITGYPDLHGDVVEADKLDDLKDGQIVEVTYADGRRELKKGKGSKAAAEEADGPPPPIPPIDGPNTPAATSTAKPAKG